MHRKLCVHAQFFVQILPLSTLKLKRINYTLEAKLKGRSQNEFDIAFEYNYKANWVQSVSLLEN
jgi:hypothetical protein